jgi:hypothetical protein
VGCISALDLIERDFTGIYKMARSFHMNNSESAYKAKDVYVRIMEREEEVRLTEIQLEELQSTIIKIEGMSRNS